MKHFIAIVLALVFAGFCTVQSSSGQTSQSSSGKAGAQDQEFLTNAIKGNRAEVALGKLVESKATDPSVKQFAQMMVKDHTPALHKLVHLAQQKNVTVPEGLASDAQELMTKLKGESGKSFDKTYMNAMVKDHEKDVQEFQQASQSATDPELKSVASTLLPTLQQHLAKAEQIDKKLGGKQASSSGK
jgi:putative membrane protein